jgi:hypothetical protein
MQQIPLSAPSLSVMGPPAGYRIRLAGYPTHADRKKFVVFGYRAGYTNVMLYTWIAVFFQMKRHLRGKG